MAFIIAVAYTVLSFTGYQKRARQLLDRLKHTHSTLWESLGQPEEQHYGREGWKIEPSRQWRDWITSDNEPTTDWRFNKIHTQAQKLYKRSRAGLIITCISILFVISNSLLLPSSQRVSQADPYLGNAADHSYAGLVMPSKNVSRQSANGGWVTMDQFSGQYIWAEYAAPWCSACTPQTQASHQVERDYSGRVTFVTIMTSEAGENNKPPTVPTLNTAIRWAEKFNLNKDRVLVATNLWSRTVPHHILFSPSGQTLYKHTGGLTTQQMKDVIDQYRTNGY